MTTCDACALWETQKYGPTAGRVGRCQVYRTRTTYDCTCAKARPFTQPGPISPDDFCIRANNPDTLRGLEKKRGVIAYEVCRKCGGPVRYSVADFPDGLATFLMRCPTCWDWTPDTVTPAPTPTQERIPDPVCADCGSDLDHLGNCRLSCASTAQNPTTEQDG